jgi:hypothetical protein
MARIKEEKIIVRFSVLLGDGENLESNLVDEDIKKEIEQLAQDMVLNKLSLQNSEIRLLVETTLENTTTVLNT